MKPISTYSVAMQASGKVIALCEKLRIRPGLATCFSHNCFASSKTWTQEAAFRANKRAIPHYREQACKRTGQTDLCCKLEVGREQPAAYEISDVDRSYAGRPIYTAFQPSILLLLRFFSSTHFWRARSQLPSKILLRSM